MDKLLVRLVYEETMCNSLLGRGHKNYDMQFIVVIFFLLQ